MELSQKKTASKTKEESGSESESESQSDSEDDDKKKKKSGSKKKKDRKKKDKRKKKKKVRNAQVNETASANTTQPAAANTTQPAASLVQKDSGANKTVAANTTVAANQTVATNQTVSANKTILANSTITKTALSNETVATNKTALSQKYSLVDQFVQQYAPVEHEKEKEHTQKKEHKKHHKHGHKEAKKHHHKHHKHADDKEEDKKPDEKKSFVQLKDFDDDEDKDILESIKFAENKLGSKMGVPHALPKESWAPVKYDVEETDLKLFQKEKKMAAAGAHEAVLGECEIDDQECITKSKVAPADDQKVQLRDWDDDEDKGIMDSIKFAENKLGAKMGTPKIVPGAHAHAPITYDVESLSQSDSKTTKKALENLEKNSGADVGVCDIEDTECRNK